MATINVSLPSDGSTADVADYNTPITTIVNEFNGNIDNANIKTGAAIATAKLATDAGIVYGMLGTDSSYTWASWTPTWTNLTVGNGTVTAKYTQLGKTVIARVSVAFGSTTSIGGSVSFTLPVTAVAIAAGSPHIGSAIYDDVGTNLYMGVVYEGSTTSGVLRVGNAAATYTGTTVLSSTVPFTWTTSDAINLSLIYEAA